MLGVRRRADDLREREAARGHASRTTDGGSRAGGIRVCQHKVPRVWREVPKDAGAVGIVIRWPEDAPRDRAGLQLRAGGPELVIPPLQAVLPRFVAFTVLRRTTPGLHHGTRYELVGDQDGTDNQPIHA